MNSKQEAICNDKTQINQIESNQTGEIALRWGFDRVRRKCEHRLVGIGGVVSILQVHLLLRSCDTIAAQHDNIANNITVK